MFVFHLGFLWMLKAAEAGSKEGQLGLATLYNKGIGVDKDDLLAKEWEKKAESPAWLYEENKRWRGNYKVFYWMEEWKQIIYGTPTSYLTRVMEAGFDGVYLDIIDAYEYYKEL